MNNILFQLPPEIVSLIVKNVDVKDLYACTLINKQFYTETNPLLWQAPNVRNDVSLLKVISGIFVAQQPLGQHIRKLDFYMGLTNATFLLFMKHTNHLEELDIMNARLITDEGFKHFPQHCPKLKTLYIGYTGITQQSMLLLGQHCRHLRKLTLSWCSHLSPNTFAALADCPLEDLTIRVDHSHGEHWMTVDETIPDLTRFHLLTCLTLSSCSADFVGHLLQTDNPAGYKPWPRLTHLDIEECSGLDDHHIIPFIKSHPSLTSVYFPEDCISDATLNVIPSFLPAIRRLGLYTNPRFTNHGIRRLIRNCPLLIRVSTCGCGILVKDFPEVGDHDSGDEFLDYLDQAAIDKIRLGRDSAEDGFVSVVGSNNDIYKDGDELNRC